LISLQNADIADTRDNGTYCGYCHGNRFWDYTICTWPMMGNNDTTFRINMANFQSTPAF